MGDDFLLDVGDDILLVVGDDLLLDVGDHFFTHWILGERPDTDPYSIFTQITTKSISHLVSI